MSKEGNDIPHIPSELKYVVRWQSCSSELFKSTLWGGFAGGISGLLALRVSWGRVAMIGLGAGTGFGLAFSKCRQSFKKDNLYNPETVVLIKKKV